MKRQIIGSKICMTHEKKLNLICDKEKCKIKLNEIPVFNQIGNYLKIL